MEPLCKTCCNGACPFQVTKDRLVLSCIEYIPGMMIGEIADRSNKHFKKEIELESEVNSLKTQVEFIKGQANDMRETYVKIAKEALTIAGEYKKENEELKRILKNAMSDIYKKCSCDNSDCDICEKKTCDKTDRRNQ